jgi:hypothetical protein
MILVAMILVAMTVAMTSPCVGEARAMEERA